MNPINRCLPRIVAGALSLAGAACAHATSSQFEISSPQYKLIPITRGASKSNGPHWRNAFGDSTNWAGYAAESNLAAPTLGSVTAISGSWTVPATVGAKGNHIYDYSSAWVGIDGYEDAQLQALFSGLSPLQKKQMILATQTVEQIGTEQDWTGKASSYYAWFEFYPYSSYLIQGFTVKAGDSITGSVTYLGSNRWQSKLTNNTRKLTVTVTAAFAADRYSAEWIIEAPSSSSGVLPLADFGSISFSKCTATIKGITLPIGKASWEAIDMINEAGTALKASTSDLNSSGDGFTSAWLSSN